MIRCASCQNEEMVGALYCSKCGAQLNYQDVSPAKTAMYTKETGPISGPPIGASFQPESIFTPTASKYGVAIRLLETDQVIPLESNKEFTIGRVSGNQPILPDIDLTAHQAYDLGVSRLHATINIESNLVTITDLGSANGTQVNGNKIASHDPQPLVNGDLIALGKFKLQIIIQK